MNVEGDPILAAAIRDVPDFPKVGVLFKDITPLLADGNLLRRCIDGFVKHTRAAGAEKIAGIDARGFLFGATVADRLGIGFVPIRKKGKLPFTTRSVSYKLEYGEADLEIHTDALRPGEKVALVDDLLATGGTAAAAVQLIQSCEAEVVAAQFLIELEFLEGRQALAPIPLFPLLRYH
jgi:adenine phosphoribosyltransferase